jgi:hypothetical protein
MLRLARWSTTHRLYIAIGWVIPGWLDRVLPRVNIEGAATRLSPVDEGQLAALLSTDEPVPAGTRGGTEG